MIALLEYLKGYNMKGQDVFFLIPEYKTWNKDFK